MKPFKVWLRNFVAWKRNFLTSLVGDAVDPLIYFLGFGYGFKALIGNVNGMDYVAFIVPGIIMSSAMTGTSYECTFGSFTRIAGKKTYRALLIAPIMIEDLVIGEILWGMTKGFLAALIMMLFTMIFGYFPGWCIIFNILNILLTTFTFASTSLFFTTISRSYDFFSYYFTAFISPMFILSGIFFPINSLPSWTAFISRVFPLTYSVHLAREIYSKNLTPSLILDVFFLLIWGLIFFYLSMKFMKKRLIT
jgi:lipooligosaccharide transport system permease protein